MTDRIECYGVAYLVRYDRSARAWCVYREDGSTYEPLHAPTRDLAILYLGLAIADRSF